MLLSSYALTNFLPQISLNHIPPTSAAVFFIFSLLHLAFNYLGVRAVVMDSFNKSRFEIVVNNYFDSLNVLDPVETAKLEHLFPIFTAQPSKVLSHWSLLSFLKSSHGKHVDICKRLAVCSGRRWVTVPLDGNVYLFFSDRAVGDDYMRGMFAALLEVRGDAGLKDGDVLYMA